MSRQLKSSPLLAATLLWHQWWLCCSGFSSWIIFLPDTIIFPFFFFFFFSPFIFHPHANDWLNGHPCFWSFQEWATKMLTYILLDPVSKLWAPRNHFLTATPERARELSLLYWGDIGAWSVTWSRESLAQEGRVSELFAGRGCWSLGERGRLLHDREGKGHWRGHCEVWETGEREGHLHGGREQKWEEVGYIQGINLIRILRTTEFRILIIRREKQEVQHGEHMYTRGRFMLMYGKISTIL